MKLDPQSPFRLSAVPDWHAMDRLGDFYLLLHRAGEFEPEWKLSRVVRLLERAAEYMVSPPPDLSHRAMRLLELSRRLGASVADPAGDERASGAGIVLEYFRETGGPWGLAFHAFLAAYLDAIAEGELSCR